MKTTSNGFNTTTIALVATLVLTGATTAQEAARPQEHGANQQYFVHGAPHVQSEEWTIAAGGRI